MDFSPLTLRERNRLQTNRTIMTAAFELFAEQGFDATTVEQICDRAQVSRATFFNYFGQKEGLLAAFGRARIARIQAWFEMREKSPEPIRRGELIAVFEEYAAENARVGPTMRAVVGPILSRVAADETMARVFRDINMLLTKVMESMQERGEVRTDVEPEILAMGFWNIYIGATVSALSAHFDLDRLPVVIGAQMEAWLKGGSSRA